MLFRSREDIPIYKGGPMSTDTLFYLHTLENITDSLPIADGLYLNGDFTAIKQFITEGNSIKGSFKVYTTDIGILMAMLDYGTQADILKGNLLGYKGAIFENLMADFLCKSGQKLYYFHKDSGLELDFLVRFKGECVILEVKAKTGKAKSMTTVLKNKDVYYVNNAIKLGQYNVGCEGDILTIPLYMGFLVEDKLADVIIPDVDVSLLTTI